MKHDLDWRIDERSDGYSCGRAYCGFVMMNLFFFLPLHEEIQVRIFVWEAAALYRIWNDWVPEEDHQRDGSLLAELRPCRPFVSWKTLVSYCFLSSCFL